jgi:hypothetical protein
MMRNAGESILAVGLLALSVFTSIAANGRLQAEDGIFSSVLNQLARDKSLSRWVVQATPLRLVRPSSADWTWFGPSAKALQAKVAGAPDSASADFTDGVFPHDTSLVPTLDLQRLREALRAPDAREVWAAFRRQHRVEAFYAFSTPIVTDDGLTALVSYSRTCGPQCGESGFVLLNRASLDAPWRVTKQLPKAIS